MSTASLHSGCTDEDFTERACSQHISDQVNLKWTLTGTDANGITSLKGISLSSTMLSLITVAPLQWGKLKIISKVKKARINIRFDINFSV